MPRKWVPTKGDYVRKGSERGRVIERISQRTNRPYLTVQILSGPRRWTFEFPERGWVPDDDGVDDNRPTREDDEGWQAWNTRHHSRESKRFEAQPRPLTEAEEKAAAAQRKRDREATPF